MHFSFIRFMKTTVAAGCLSLIGLSAEAQTKPFELKLWPSTPPGVSGITSEERVDENGLLHNVTEPSLFVYPANPAKYSGISVMMSALLHNSSTILVVANSLRLMFMKPGDGRA